MQSVVVHASQLLSETIALLWQTCMVAGSLISHPFCNGSWGQKQTQLWKMFSSSIDVYIYFFIYL